MTAVLEKSKQQYLKKIVPWGKLISQWTADKAEFLSIYPAHGFKTSLIVADIILESDWGNHPLSKPEYENGYANNLSLLRNTEYWEGKVRKHEGKEYKAFRDWEQYSIEASDYLVFSRLYDDILRESSLQNQIKLFSKVKDNSFSYCANIELLILYYNLTKYDDQ